MERNIRYITLFLIMTVSSALSAQPFEHSAGVRAGYSSGIVYKGFFRHRLSAVELEMLYNRHGFNLTGMFEHHLEPFQNRRIHLYAGGGVFGGNWDHLASVGVTAVGGLEYTLRDHPLSLSLDWKPMLNLYSLFEVDILDFGLSIRYYFSL